ncbi:MAG: hypothetical protein HYT81_04770 [Gemmatimonadetes bacterium]|nr:hypothetical protein [Gemmatimonadota bacterium]
MNGSRTLSALTVLGLVPSLTPALRAQTSVIDTIVVITHDVFDAAEARRNTAFAIANAIRFKTRPQIVRRELLFRAGQPYDSARVAETARNLRRLGLFRDVTIDTTRLDGRLAAVVETRDGWTTELQLNGRSTGGEFTWSVGLEERNFLGVAAAVGTQYRHDADRTAWTLLTRWNRVLASRLLVAGSYDDRSDGRLGGWAVGFPFRAFGDRSALEWTGEAGRHRVLQFRDGDSVNAVQRRALRLRMSGALAPYTAGDGYVRTGLVAQMKREAYVRSADTLLPVPDSVSGTVGLQLDWRRARFEVVTHYNGFAREEDIDLSTRIRLAAWAAPAGFGYQRSGVGPELEAQTGTALGRTFVRLELQANGLFTTDGVDSARVWSGLTVASRIAPRHATVLHVEAGVRRGLPPGAEFDLGHGLGPRAFDSHAFTGTRSVWGTLEHRWFAVDEVLHLLGIGVAGFLDFGGAWYADQPARAGGDVGIGLRLGATRATGANVGRFDLAYRFGDEWSIADGGSGHRWVLSFGRSYSF